MIELSNWTTVTVGGLLAQISETGTANESGGAAEGGQAGGFLEQFIGNPINLVLFSVILFMLLVVRPQRKEMRKMQQLLAGLKKNDRVVTSGGIHGVVVQAASGESTVVIRIDENSGARMTVNRESIAKVLGSDAGESTK
ncbi:MAG: preprotein translocase subunit YajC [Pirellulaceae bacterium]|nr:preprotein translocase subunit YajC [Pirellulaceae bacterium]